MDPSCLVTTVQAGSGDVMVWGMFSWHTLGHLVPIGHCLNATAYLRIVSHPLMRTHPLMATSRIMHHVTKLKSFQIGFLNMTMSSLSMAPTVTRSQPNRASLGCGVMGASCPGCTSHKSPSTARCYPINMGQHF